MLILCKLSVLMLTLTLHGQVHAGKIIGGHVSVAHSRPYMALLEIQTQDNQTKHCGGFLVSDEFVMTAAHCQMSPESFKVHLGVDKATKLHQKTVQTLSVEKVFPHKEYNAAGYKNDIMLLKLASSASSSSSVKPVTLAHKTDSSVPKSCIVSGWGQTDRTNRKMSLTLMEVNVTLTDDEACEDEKVYCSEGNHGPGSGDSGGPLVCEDGRVYGVVSASRPINQRNMLCKYTNIPEKRDWINCIMKHHDQHSC